MNLYPDVAMLPIPTPTLPPHQSTNSFIAGERSLALIDSGLYDEELIGVLMDHLKGKPGARLERLFLSHRHPDHRVGAAEIRERTGCKVGIHRYEAERMDDLTIDFVFDHGDQFPVDGGTLTVIHTPGHSIGHCCFFLESVPAAPAGQAGRAVLFTGDHILGSGTSIIVPPEGDMIAYMDSLDLLLSYPARVICPGHGPVVWDARAKILEYIEHRRQRELAILEGLRQGAETLESLVARVYVDVPEFLHGLAGFSLEAHLIKLEKEGAVRRKEEGGRYELA